MCVFGLFQFTDQQREKGKWLYSFQLGAQPKDRKAGTSKSIAF